MTKIVCLKHVCEKCALLAVFIALINYDGSNCTGDDDANGGGSDIIVLCCIFTVVTSK